VFIVKQNYCPKFVILFLSLLILFFSWEIPIFGADLKIISKPAGAEIWLDGVNTSKKTPHTLTEISEESHHIELRGLPKYRNESRKITVKPGLNVVEVFIPEKSLYYMWRSLPALLIGTLMTLFLTAIAVFNGIIIGTFTGVARVIHNKVINLSAGFYVDFIRGTPLLVQIFMIHYGLPPLLGGIFNNGQPISLNPFLSALLALSINSGAYVAEIIRAGIQSIDKGQMEAARSLGMTYRQSMRHVILPQALKRVIPPLGNEFIAMLKDSSLVSVIGMEELVRKAQIIVTRSYRPTETWLEVGLLFLLMTIPFTRIVARLERRLQVND
jgi:glutamine transport system permease protein